MSGEVRYGDFKRKRELRRSEVIDSTANIAATIGMRDGRSPKEVIDELKQALDERLLGLTVNERLQVEVLARQKIDARRVGAVGLEPVLDSSGHEIGISSSQPITVEEDAVVKVWADIIGGDTTKIGKLAEGLRFVGADRAPELMDMANELAVKRAGEGFYDPA